MGEKTFYLEIIASDRLFFRGDCQHLIFTGMDGDYGILPMHESMVTCLAAGELKYLVDGRWRYAAVSDGFLEVMPDSVVIWADTVEDPDEIDVKRANEAKLRAEERLRQKQSIREYYHTQAALNRAMNRLKVTKRHMM